MMIKLATTTIVVATCVAFGLTSFHQLSQRGAWVTPAKTAGADRCAASVFADGRVTTRPGGRVTLSAGVGGKIAVVRVTEGERVGKGAVLAELDAKEARALLRQALGSASEAHARLRARRGDATRIKSLVASGSLAPHEADRITEERAAAEGRLLAANAAATQARAVLDKTQIIAPIDGVVVSRTIEAGESVAVGAPLFVVADLRERRVEVEVDEYDVGHVGLGALADVSADGFVGQRWSGAVDEIPDALGPRRLRPLDPSRPTDSAVLLVKVSLPNGSPLKLGQRVSVRIAAR